LIRSAFGEAGSTGVKPGSPAKAAPESASAQSTTTARIRPTGCHSMKVAKAVRSGTRVELPAGVGRPTEVYVNGVVQRAGADYRLENGSLVFSRELHQEGKLGFWRWTSIVFGVAGTYRQNDVVDVIYESAAGGRTVASNLPVEP
jgi:hypothetical protein